MFGNIGRHLLVATLAACLTIGHQARAEDSPPLAGGPGAVGGGDPERVVVRTTADCIRVIGPDIVWSATDVRDLVKMMEQWKVNTERQMKENLGASDEEWAILQPKIEKVTAAQQEARGQMRFRVAGVDPTIPSDAQKALDALKKLLANKDAKAEDLKAALAAFREARAKVQAAVEKAQKELKEVLTVRQEAQLLAAGVLQ